MNPKTIQIVVNEDNYQNIRIDRWLSYVENSYSRSFIVNLFSKNQITVNNQFVNLSYKVKLGDFIEIQIPSKEDTTLIPLNANLDILFQNTNYVIINKPSGLVVHPAAGHFQDTLVNILLFHFKDLSMKNENRPGIVHRIDKDTSGLLVVAKNDRTHEALSNQFKNKTTHRIYYALVEGSPKIQNGKIQSYLQRSNSDRKKYSSFKSNNKILRTETEDLINAKWAVTHYEVISKSKNMSLVKLKLETGRTHQIRVHMSELGHPIVGDINYGYSAKKFKDLNLSRFYLHAAELGFVDPDDNQFKSWFTPWPENDEKQLKLWGFNV